MAYDKVIDSAELEANLTSVADAIRTKGGTTDPLSFPDGFVSAVEEIQAGGGDVDPYAIARSISDKSITEFNDSKMVGIRDYFFYNCLNLRSVKTPNVTELGTYAFAMCQSVESIDISAFSGYVQAFTFQNCKNLKTLSIGSITKTGRHSFGGCTSLESIDLTEMTNIAQDGSFSGVPLKTAIMPKLDTVAGNSTFDNCTALKFIEYGFGNKVGTKMFYNCTALETIIMRLTTVVPLANVNAFDGCSDVIIYVPSALISEYQQATNWSTLYAAGTCNFVAIEGSEYE